MGPHPARMLEVVDDMVYHRTYVRNLLSGVITMHADTVRAWVSDLQHLDHSLDDASRIDLIRALEELKCAAEGAQGVTTADFDASQRAEQAARGVRPERQGQGIAAQVA